MEAALLERKWRVCMRLTFLFSLIASVLAIVPASANGSDRRPARHYQSALPAPPDCYHSNCPRSSRAVPTIVQASVCLNAEDWDYVRKYRDGCWWATQSSERSASIMFRGQCGLMERRSGTRPYGYLGKSGQKYTFYFPHARPGKY